MNRKIAFRVWDKKDKIWVAGWSIMQLGQLSETENRVYMQYTGLKDKNGKEIYEGDVVQADFPFNVKIVGIIRYDNFTYKLASLNQTEEAKKHGYTDFIEYWDDGENDWCSLEQLCGHDFEVIGNIYENPELLDNK